MPQRLDASSLPELERLYRTFFAVQADFATALGTHSPDASATRPSARRAGVAVRQSPSPSNMPAAGRRCTEVDREHGCTEQRPSSGMAASHDAYMQPAWACTPI